MVNQNPSKINGFQPLGTEFESHALRQNKNPGISMGSGFFFEISTVFGLAHKCTYKHILVHFSTRFLQKE